MARITLYIPISSEENKQFWLSQAQTEEMSIQFLPTYGETPFTSWGESSQLESLIRSCETEYLLIATKSVRIELGYFSLQRMIQIADATGAGIVYSDRILVDGEERKAAPTINYQTGSIRDDFEFGALMLLRTELALQALSETFDEYRFGALYNLRLKISQYAKIERIDEPLYTELLEDHRLSGEKQFDYVDPRNRERQIEMEKICTSHLKAIGAYLKPNFQTIDFSQWDFPVEASVIIPVRNREKTIGYAIESVLGQTCSFAFNLIIVDNHSNDSTSTIIESYAAKDSRVIHLQPERTDLGIGGCWNVGIESDHCGKFAIQLDSDDAYSSSSSLQTLVNAFYEQQTPMVVGTYQMTNFDLEPIPPGVIDHREWTPENGRNNALRINGLGAPRAFFTPLLRSLHLPNTSYGEDYAIGLRISREYQLGRVYEVVYNCRRWNDNSDASLSIEKVNQYNSYKDKIRSWEIAARVQLNKNYR